MSGASPPAAEVASSVAAAVTPSAFDANDSGVERDFRYPPLKARERLAAELKVEVELLLTIPSTNSNEKSGPAKKRQ